MKKVITETDVLSLWKKGHRSLIVKSDEMLTPLAADRVKILGMTIEKVVPVQSQPGAGTAFEAGSGIVALGCDHTGFKAKEMLKAILLKKGFKINDVGTTSEEACDYPDFAAEVARKVKSREAVFGIVCDATGIPSAITANKFSGIRAVTCYNEFSARSARSHNNANVLVLGAKTLGDETIKSILDVFLTTPFEGGRHQKRLDKISIIETQNFKN